MMKLRYIIGWLFVRPRRWFFGKMIRNCYLQLWWEKIDYMPGYYSPNLHWWLMYKTIFKFFKWLDYDAWRTFCTWENGWLKYKPWIARVIYRIGKTTAGWHIDGGECYHCGSIYGDPVDLSDDETGRTFILKDTWIVSTPDGTDYRFRGITICPKCGFKQDYEDGSL